MKRTVFISTIVLLTALVCWAFFYTQLTPHSQDAAHWLSGQLNSVDSLTIEKKGQRYILTLDDSGWVARVHGDSWDISAKVIPSKITDFLNEIGEFEPVGSFNLGDHAQFDQHILADPDVKLVFSFSDTKEKLLTVKIAMTGDGDVVGWNSRTPKTMYRFSKKALQQLSRPITFFLDSRVLVFNEENVSKVQLTQSFGSSWLVERQKGGYFFSLPGYLKDKHASNSELKLYIHSLALLRVDSLCLEPVEITKKVPVLTIKVWDSSNKPVSVEFFTVDGSPEVYLGRSSWLTVPFYLDAQSVSQLIRSAFDVQGRSVVNIDIGKVARFIIIHGDQLYAIDRRDAGWKLIDSKKDLSGIDMFLWRFTELQFEALPLNNLPTTAVQLMDCKLLDLNGNALAKISFFADPRLPQGQCWMKNDDGMYYPVSSRLLKDLQGMFPAADGGSDS